MGIVQLRQALRRRGTDVTAGDGGGMCQRLVRTSDLTEGLRDVGLKPLSKQDANKVWDGTTHGKSG